MSLKDYLISFAPVDRHELVGFPIGTRIRIGMEGNTLLDNGIDVAGKTGVVTWVIQNEAYTWHSIKLDDGTPMVATDLYNIERE